MGHLLSVQRCGYCWESESAPYVDSLWCEGIESHRREDVTGGSDPALEDALRRFTFSHGIYSFLVRVCKYVTRRVCVGGCIHTTGVSSHLAECVAERRTRRSRSPWNRPRSFQQRKSSQMHTSVNRSKKLWNCHMYSSWNMRKAGQLSWSINTVRTYRGTPAPECSFQVARVRRGRSGML